jgi:hypothetical protein
MLSEEDKRRIELEESYRSEVRLKRAIPQPTLSVKPGKDLKHPFLWFFGLMAVVFPFMVLAVRSDRVSSHITSSHDAPSPASTSVSDVKLVTTQDVVCAKTEEDLIRYFGAIKQRDLQVFTSMTENGSGFTLLPGTTLTIDIQGDYRSHVFVETGGHALTGCWAPTQMLK